MNIRDRQQRCSQPWGFWLNTLMLLLLSLASCTGCGQKTAQEPAPAAPPIETPPAPSPPASEGAAAPAAGAAHPAPASAPGSLLYKDPNFPGISLRPWHPVVIPPQVEEKVDAADLRYKTGEITFDAFNKLMYQIYEAELEPIACIRFFYYIGGGGYASDRAQQLLEKALAENPNDFETLYTWAEIGIDRAERDWDEEDAWERHIAAKTAAYRRLYEMNPMHPMVLFRLAQWIFPTHPAEALGYAQQAQQLEPRFIPQGLDGVCYYQMGDYEQALAAFRRAYAAAPEVAKRAAYNRIQRVLSTINSATAQATEQRHRDLGLPLMGRSLFLGRHP